MYKLKVINISFTINSNLLIINEESYWAKYTFIIKVLKEREINLLIHLQSNLYYPTGFNYIHGPNTRLTSSFTLLLKSSFYSHLI